MFWSIPELKLAEPEEGKEKQIAEILVLRF
jgi:hypothetical protein